MDPTTEPLEVMVFCLSLGSHYKNSKELAKYLMKAQFPDGRQRYRVSVFVWQDNKDFKDGEGVTVWKIPHDHPLSDETLAKHRTMEALMTESMDMNLEAMKMLNEHIGILEEAKKTKYDAILTDGAVPDKVMAMYLDSPYLQQLFYLPSTLMQSMLAHPLPLNSIYPLFSSARLNWDDGFLQVAKMKIQEVSFINMITIVFGKFVLHDGLIHPDIRD